MAWIENDVVNANVKFLNDATFLYLFSIHLIRMGARRCKSDALWTARVAFAPLFVGTHMTNYQDLHLCDLKTRVQMPHEIGTFYDQHSTISVSGHHSKGEGTYMVLEAKNRRLKMWMPPGVPTEAQWLRTCRNIQNK